MKNRAAILFVALAFGGMTSSVQAQCGGGGFAVAPAPSITITSIVSGKTGAGAGIQIKYDVTGAANTTYGVKITAQQTGKALITLATAQVTTAGDGTAKGNIYKNTAAPLTIGVKYTITTNLYANKDATGDPIATNSMDVTISSDPFNP